MNIRAYIFIIIAICFSINLKSQNLLDSKKYIYQNLLENLGLHSYLELNDLILDSDLLLVELKLNSSQDSSIAFWQTLSLSFQKNHHINIEELLFIKTAYLFDVPYNQLKIRISNFNINGESNINGFIFFKEEKIINRGFPNRSKIKGSILIDSFKINPFFDKAIKMNLPLSQTKQEVYDQIKSNAKLYFLNSNKNIEFSSPVSQPLVINIKNIKGEVIPSGTSLLVPDPYEHLSFIIRVEIDRDEKSIECFVELDGKYGSGLWLFKPTLKANYIEMDPKYKAELDNYLDNKFLPELHTWISKN